MQTHPVHPKIPKIVFNLYTRRLCYNGCMSIRVEHDLLGEMEVPAEAYYGIHTLRAHLNFSLSGLTLHPELIRALADVKKACALANLRTGHIDAPVANAIAAACDEIAAGKLQDQFITDVFQGGAGTSANMNANEVIANRAIELLGETRATTSWSILWITSICPSRRTMFFPQPSNSPPSVS